MIDKLKNLLAVIALVLILSIIVMTLNNCSAAFKDYPLERNKSKDDREIKHCIEILKLRKARTK